MNKFLILILSLALNVPYLNAMQGLGGKAGMGGKAGFGGGATASTAPVVIGSQNSSFYTTQTVTTSGAATAGGRIIVFFASNSACNDATAGITSITDASSNTYASDFLQFNNGNAECTWSAHVGTTLSSGATIVLNCATTSACGTQTWVVYTSATGAKDQTASATNGFSNSIAIVSGSWGGSLTASDVVFYFFETQGATDTIASPASGTVLEASTQTGFGTLQLSWLNASSGTPTNSATISSGSDAWNAEGIAYKY